MKKKPLMGLFVCLFVHLLVRIVVNLTPWQGITHALYHTFSYNSILLTVLVLGFEPTTFWAPFNTSTPTLKLSYSDSNAKWMSVKDCTGSVLAGWAGCCDSLVTECVRVTHFTPSNLSGRYCKYILPSFVLQPRFLPATQAAGELL